MAVIWMLDTNTLIYFINRKPNYERVARRMSGRSPGELRMSAITLAELRFGIVQSERARENEATLEELLGLVQADDFSAGPHAISARSERPSRGAGGLSVLMTC